MPLLFDYGVTLKSLTLSYSWNLDVSGHLYVTNQMAESFRLTRVSSDQYGNNAYAIFSTSWTKYLSKSTDSAGKKKIAATGQMPETSLILIAEPTTNDANDAFVWLDPSTGDYLRVSSADNNYILIDGGSGANNDCQFISTGSALATISQ